MVSGNPCLSNKLWLDNLFPKLYKKYNIQISYYSYFATAFRTTVKLVRSLFYYYHSTTPTINIVPYVL